MRDKPQTENLSASLEDYLEAIYNITLETGVARVTDIAKLLSVQKASVSGALKQLAGKKLVEHEPYSTVSLTASGKALAEDVLRRHRALLTFLTDILDVDADDAEKAACALEHALSAKLLDKLQLLVGTLKNCPRCGENLGRPCSEGNSNCDCGGS